MALGGGTAHLPKPAEWLTEKMWSRRGLVSFERLSRARIMRKSHRVIEPNHAKRCGNMPVLFSAVAGFASWTKWARGRGTSSPRPSRSRPMSPPCRDPQTH